MFDAHPLPSAPEPVSPAHLYVPVELNPWPKARPCVGLSWRAEPHDWRRSLPLELAASLVDDLPCDLEILQQSLTPKEADRFPAARSRTVLEIANVVAGLDLVITVDTVIAHIAKGFARPTWLLLHANSDGRWLPSPNEPDWNSTMRIYEQSHAGDWHDVVRRVADDLCFCCQGDSFVLSSLRTTEV
jgi:hypothetical protein